MSAATTGSTPAQQRYCHYPALPVPGGLPVSTTPPRPCPYLPGRREVSRGFRCDRVPGWLYQEFMDAGFRRSGRVFYQMACPGCRACTPLRVPVGSFVPSRSQRRVLARNRDLAVAVGRPVLDEERRRLYTRYLLARHDAMMSASGEALEDFLYRSPTETIEFSYRTPGGRLVGVGICDATPTALSTVYFYFDPDETRRGLGTFSSLQEIQTARSSGLAYYYLGYWIPGCRKMEYKSRFRPHEILSTDGLWRPGSSAGSAPLTRPTAERGAGCR